MSDINNLVTESFGMNPKKMYEEGPIDLVKQNKELRRSGEKPSQKKPIRYKQRFRFFK